MSRRMWVISSIMRMRTCASTPLVVLGVTRAENIAFWETLWMVGTLVRVDRVEEASITIFSFPLKYFFHDICSSSSNNVSKSVIFCSPRTRYSLFANRLHTRSSYMFFSIPLHFTRRSCPRTFSSQSFSHSRFTRDSSPDWQVRRKLCLMMDEWCPMIFISCISEVYRKNRKEQSGNGSIKNERKKAAFFLGFMWLS